MAAKRLVSESWSDTDEPEEKRMKTKPSFASVIGEAVMVNCLRTALEPVLRKVVNEEVGGVLQRIRSFTRSPSLRIEAPSTLQLIFPKPLSLPIFTGSKINDEDNNHLQVILIDTRGDQRNNPVSLPNPIKVDIVVLDGDFPSGDGNDWTSKEFDKNIVRERTGKRPLLAGELTVTVREGVASIGDIEFTDNSSWIRSRKFRIGAKVAHGSFQSVRIREAMTEAFVVKDHRGELYKKHHPPMLHDDVWRLEKIGKDGAFHKKLTSEGIKTVQDFLKMSVIDLAKLRKILGAGMSDKMWDITFKHAKTCDMGNKQYVFRGPNFTILLNPICQVLRAEVNGFPYPTHNMSNNINRVYLENLVRQAYMNWQSLEEIDGVATEIGLLTQGEHMVDQYPNHQQITLRPYHQNEYLSDGPIEGYIPSDIRADQTNSWQINQAFMNAPLNNGVRLNILESNKDDDLASPRSYTTGS